MKKITAVLMAVLMLASCLCLSAFAAEEKTVTLKIANFNVAGLPDVNNWIGKNENDISENQERIGQYLSAGGFDIVAVQEDFTYHNYLRDNLVGFNYETEHSGSFLGGDGMNIFTKNYPLYNTTRYGWEERSGVLEDGADDLSAKGILYSVIEIAEGVYVDFYNIHADAYDSEKDRAAREDNFRQVTDLINANYEKNNRPVVIVGDFNYHVHGTPADDSNIHYYFLEKSGLTDAWVTLYNGGDYHNFDKWKATDDPNHFDHYWGRWDSVEKVMYKNGGGVKVEAVSFNYEFVTVEDGSRRVSDHANAICELKFTVTGDFAGNDQELGGAVTVKKSIITELMGFFKILLKLFTNFDALLGFIGL